MEDYRSRALSNLEKLENLVQRGPLPASEVRACLDDLCKVNLRSGSKKKWDEGELEKARKAARGLREMTEAALETGTVVLESGPADRRLEAALPVLRRSFDAVRESLARAKRRARMLDFADLEVHALRALEDPGVLGYYGERWRAFLVDEFQDTNPVQAKLLGSLVGKHARLTIVGDERQSIYGFRRADVAVFRRFREQIVAGGGQERKLSRSYRTHGALLEKTNAIFAAVLEGLHEDLQADHPDAPHEGPHVRAYALDTSREAAIREDAPRRVPITDLRRAEAKHIARLVGDMIRSETLVRDRENGGSRPVRPGDFVLLARAWEPLDGYGDALEAAGLPTVHAGGGSLLETREAKDGTALLRFLAHPHDDVALVALLRAPFFAVDDRTLTRLALERDEEVQREGGAFLSWWAWLGGRSPSGNLGHAYETLRKLVESARKEAPSALLAEADELTGYAAVVANLPGASRKEADWRGFVDLVRELEHPHESVFGVACALKRLEEASAEMPRPRIQAENAVGLMSIHAAKGLEWPVVIVPDLARVWREDPGTLLFDPEIGAALKPESGEGGGILYHMLKERRRREGEAEARRVYYVAPTRARDHLILTATSYETTKLCGMTLLLPGLRAAGIECETVDFDPADAVPPETRSQPTPEPTEVLI